MCSVLFYTFCCVLIAQAVWAFLVSFIILYIINKIPGLHLRQSELDEVLGGDYAEMGEVFLLVSSFYVPPENIHLILCQGSTIVFPRPDTSWPGSPRTPTRPLTRRIKPKKRKRQSGRRKCSTHPAQCHPWTRSSPRRAINIELNSASYGITPAKISSLIHKIQHHDVDFAGRGSRATYHPA